MHGVFWLHFGHSPSLKAQEEVVNVVSQTSLAFAILQLQDEEPLL
jgi:hypothetical protein